MATRTQIQSVRALVDDPAGIIAIVDVADKAALPAAPVPQTAYCTLDTGRYWSCNLVDSATPDDYTALPLVCSDVDLGATIDSEGQRGAIRLVYRRYIAQLGRQYSLKIISDGANSSTTQSLKELLDYYREALANWEEAWAQEDGDDCGLYVITPRPTIGEGNV